jgi:hypothetical protein
MKRTPLAGSVISVLAFVASAQAQDKSQAVLRLKVPMA